MIWVAVAGLLSMVGVVWLIYWIVKVFEEWKQ